MNTANFSEYLQNPSLLYQISYEELKTLIVQYPYNQNLRYLITQKSNLENNSDYENYLRSAAIISTDRPHLYHILKEQRAEPVVEDSFILEEETLELKNLEQLDLNEKQLETLEEDVPVPTFDTNTAVDLPKEEVFDTFPELSPNGAGDYEQLVEEEFEEEIQLPTLEEETSLANLMSDEEAPIEEAAPASENAIEQLIDDTARVEVATAVAATAAIVSTGVQEDAQEKIEEEVIEEEVTTPEANVAAVVVDTIEEEASLESLFETEMPNDEVVEEEPVATSVETTTAAEVENINPIVKFTPQVTSLSQLLDADELQLKRRVRKHVRPLSRRHFQQKDVSIRKVEEVALNLKRKEEKVEEYAQKSIQETTDIASETYASLLIRQNQYEKAIQVYDRLKLIFPEKSTFFAEQIQSLEDKL